MEHCGRQNNALFYPTPAPKKDVRILIPRTCDYVRLLDKGQLKLLV